MERFRYDRSSKWLIEHHGDSILRLAGVDDVIAWKPLPAEVVQPRQLPDGLLEVERRGDPKNALYLIEIETYADRRIDEQIMDDMMFIFQARGVVPEVVLIVLSPKGNAQVRGQAEEASPSGQTRISGRWPVVELWKVSAEAMLALREPGLVPWISLMHSARPPEQVLKECREVIDAKAKPEELRNILAVSQILASLKYNDRWLFTFFGGKEAVIESPYLNEIIEEQVAKRTAERFPKQLAEKVAELLPEKVAEQVAEQLPKKVAEQVAVLLPEKVAEKVVKRMHRAIETILKTRFGAVPADVAASLEKVTNDDDLDSLILLAGTCADIDSFRQKLSH